MTSVRIHNFAKEIKIGNLYLLRQSTNQDIPQLVNGHRDVPNNYTESDGTIFIKRGYEGHVNKTHFSYSIADLMDPSIVLGIFSINNIVNKEDPDLGLECEIGFSIFPTFRRSGIIKIVIRHVLNYLFQVQAFSRVFMLVDVKNENCNKLAEKLGFIKTNHCVHNEGISCYKYYFKNDSIDYKYFLRLHFDQ